MFLGIEIGGTKLQLGVGRGDGSIVALDRAKVEAAAGAERIRAQIIELVPRLLDRAGLVRRDIRAAGIGFGGPVDAAKGVVTKSHQVEGWTDFPLAEWARSQLGWPTVVHNDADTAGLAEACLGAGRGLSPIFYITVGSGIGGGLIMDQQIYRGAGSGAAELGHLVLPSSRENTFEGNWRLNEPPRDGTIESISSGWAIEQRLRSHIQAALSSESCSEISREQLKQSPNDVQRMLRAVNGDISMITVELIAREARAGNELAERHLAGSIRILAWAIAQMIALVCPRRIVIGGGVASLGDQLFEPLRREVAREVFVPFNGSFDIHPASLGEAVVVHGALRLAANGVRSSLFSFGSG
jgi:glucokinase